MALRAEISVPVALGTAALVWGVYSLALPNMADARACEPNDKNLASAERSALIISTVVAAGISLLSGDPTPFVVGGSTAVLLSWFHRHHNMINPTTQRVFNVDQYSERGYRVESQA